tara:strand:+ start:685 stop:870 length:186 start_codon:yes stop_codon:yes gene_type:complete
MSQLAEVIGWGGRIRTYGTRYQKALPYRLATPQQMIDVFTLDFPLVQGKKMDFLIELSLRS